MLEGGRREHGKDERGVLDLWRTTEAASDRPHRTASQVQEGAE